MTTTQHCRNTHSERQDPQFPSTPTQAAIWRATYLPYTLESPNLPHTFPATTKSQTRRTSNSKILHTTHPRNFQIPSCDHEGLRLTPCLDELCLRWCFGSQGMCWLPQALRVPVNVSYSQMYVKREPSTNFGPHLQLPLPNSNDNSFVELTTTLQLPKLKADGLYYMALWPSFSTVDEPSGDIIIHKTSALSTDNYHFPCHDENLKDKWCVLTDVYRWNGATDPVGTEVLGAAIPIPVGSAVDIHYLWHADIGNMTQTASVGGQIISNISYRKFFQRWNSLRLWYGSF